MTLMFSPSLYSAEWDYPVFPQDLCFKVKILGLHSGYARLSVLPNGPCHKKPSEQCHKFRYSVIIDSTLFGETRILSDVEFLNDSKEPHSVRHFTLRGDKLIPMEINFLYSIAKMQFIEPVRTYTFDLLPTSHVMATLPISLRYGEQFIGQKDGALFYDDWLREIVVECRKENKVRICGMNGTDYLHYYGKHRVPTYILLVPVKFLGIHFGNVSAVFTNNKEDKAKSPKYTIEDLTPESN